MNPSIGKNVFASVALLFLLLGGFARAEITAVLARGEGDRTWLVCTDVDKDKKVTTIVRRLADPLRGIWVESLRLGGRVVDASAIEDRLALLSEDGTWRLAWDDTSVGGPKPPDGYTLRKIAADGDTLWAIAAGPNDVGSLLKWREKDGWTVAKTLPDGVPLNAVALGTSAGEPWIAALRSPAIELFHLSNNAWQPGPAVVVPEAAWYVGSYAFVPGADKPLLTLRTHDAGLSLLVPSPLAIHPLPRMGEAIVAGPVLKLFHVKDGKIEQTTVDDRGLGSAFGPAAVADPARPLPPRGEWVNPLVLAILTLLTLRALRPRPDEPLTVAGGLTPAPIVRRFAAVVIDAGPCVAIGVWAYSVFGGSMEELPRTGLAAILASYLSLLGYLAHVAACEVAFGRSMGKWLMGLKVVSIDGHRASAGQVLMRNLLRLLEIQLFLPMFIVFMTPTGQRLGDLAARTMVTIEPAGASADDTAGTGPPNSDGDAA